jgi:spore coat protein CotH
MDFCNLVTSANDQTFAARLGEFVDVDALARYLAVLVWIANPDSLLQQGQNYYLYLHPKTRQLMFVPWDQDHSFGQFLWSSEHQQQQLDIMHPWTMPNRFLERTFAVPAFKQKYLDRLAELARTLTMPERLWAQVDELAAALGTTIDQEPARSRIPLFKHAMAGESYPRPFYGGTVTPLRPFVKARQASVLSQLRATGR